MVGRASCASPDLAVALSEGGIGWVPMLIDRVDYVLDHSASGNESTSWPVTCDPARSRPQLLVLHHRRPLDGRRCAHRIGVDHIMVESDYPHADSTWPDTQDRAGRGPWALCPTTSCG